MSMLAPRPAQGFSRKDAVKREIASILRHRAANLDNRPSHGRFEVKRGRSLKAHVFAVCHPFAH
jgi:hypothetical protein